MLGKEYAVDLADACFNAFTRQAKGDLISPDGDESARIFTAKGGSAITTQSTTSSAVVVYDPEISTRSGQLGAIVYERNSSDVVTKVSKISIGRPTSEFLAAGVLSSGLKVSNSSGTDVIGGSQTSAIVNAMPEKVATLTATDVANFVPDHERDMVQGVGSRDDATMTIMATSHLGSKRGLCKSKTISNVATSTFSAGEISATANVTIGTTMNYRTGVADNANIANIAVGASNIELTDAQVQAALDAPDALFRAGADSTTDGIRVFMDTGRLNAGLSPLTANTYAAEVSGQIMLGTPSAVTIYRAGWLVVGIDAAGNVIKEAQLNIDRLISTASTVSTTTGQNRPIFVVNGTIHSTTVPIVRVAVVAKRLFNYGNTDPDQASADIPADEYYPDGSGFEVRAYEEMADIPARGVHVTVLEGLNASATVNVSAFTVLSAIPDSTNMFISTASAFELEDFDGHAASMFVRSLARSMPRAYTVSGHSVFTTYMKAMYGSEEIEVSFKALSFKQVAEMVKKSGRLAKASVHEIESMLKELQPILSTAGGAMSNVPGPIGAAGAMISDVSHMLPRK
jgi:hypothetical protein